jgi:hypothetical protein
VRTLGVDLAAQAARTAVCSIEWSGETARASVPVLGVTDDEICRLAGAHDVIGIDAPFGWPIPFVEMMCEGSPASGLEPAWTAERRDSLRFRLTDYRVRDALGRWPLSVSSDLIAIAAMRCAGLLRSLGVSDRSGDGRVFEVYPAVALGVWGFSTKGYKSGSRRARQEGQGLGELVRVVLDACPWLDLSDEARQRCLRDDDAFDALIASLVARAAHLGLVTRPTVAEVERARSEGWIAIPLADSLGQLAVG